MNYNTCILTYDGVEMMVTPLDRRVKAAQLVGTMQHRINNGGADRDGNEIRFAGMPGMTVRILRKRRATSGLDVESPDSKDDEATIHTTVPDANDASHVECHQRIDDLCNRVRELELKLEALASRDEACVIDAKAVDIRMINIVHMGRKIGFLANEIFIEFDRDVDPMRAWRDTVPSTDAKIYSHEVYYKLVRDQLLRSISFTDFLTKIENALGVYLVRVGIINNQIIQLRIQDGSRGAIYAWVTVTDSFYVANLNNGQYTWLNVDRQHLRLCRMNE